MWIRRVSLWAVGSLNSSWKNDWQFLRHMIWCKWSHRISKLCLKYDSWIFTFANSLFCIFEMDHRLAPIVITKRFVRILQFIFLGSKDRMASSIIVSSLDLDYFLLSRGKGRLVDRLFSKIFSSSSEGFSVWFHCSLSSLRWSIS